jgi:hypothetical protein
MDAHNDQPREQLHLFDPDDLNPWKLACGRILLEARGALLPRSLTELSELTGLPAIQLRQSEKLAERREAA